MSDDDAIPFVGRSPESPLASEDEPESPVPQTPPPLPEPEMRPSPMPIQRVMCMKVPRKTLPVKRPVMTEGMVRRLDKARREMRERASASDFFFFKKREKKIGIVRYEDVTTRQFLVCKDFMSIIDNALDEIKEECSRVDEIMSRTGGNPESKDLLIENVKTLTEYAEHVISPMRETVATLLDEAERNLGHKGFRLTGEIESAIARIKPYMKEFIQMVECHPSNFTMN